jgi:pimeloyl-ACP methyl ester carboxylesterase
MNMDALAPRIDCTGTTPPFGYRQFHPDVSLNFECNRWAEWIGPSAIGEVAGLAGHANSYPEWISGFLGLADQARAADRVFAAAYYDRAAEFFMTGEDPRRDAARDRFLQTMRAIYDVTPEHIPFGSGALPAYDLRPQRQIGPTIVMFGGFDSYIEEFLPMMAAMVDAGRRVVAFEGPGQGGALEDYGLPLMPEWERPMAAVLDHYGLKDVTAIGISMGGALVIRAAAFEPRITRAVAYDVMEDLFEAAVRQMGRGMAMLVRALLRIRARRMINTFAARAVSRRPAAEWGLRQGMLITGTRTPYDFLLASTRVSTRGISRRVTADVLLLAGADDHFIPLAVLWRQAAALTHARSVTTRTFTAAEQASNHCQTGNYAAAARVIDDWITETVAIHPEPAGALARL